MKIRNFDVFGLEYRYIGYVPITGGVKAKEQMDTAQDSEYKLRPVEPGDVQNFITSLAFWYFVCNQDSDVNECSYTENCSAQEKKFLEKVWQTKNEN